MNNGKLANQEFNWDAVKYGVSKGQRHETLTKYFNWLREQYYSLDEVIDTVLGWNRYNRPPMYPEEMVSIIYDLWEKRPIRNLENLIAGDIDAMLEEKQPIGIGSWFVEPDMEGCYRFMAVLRDGAHYESVYIPGKQTFEAVARWVPPKSKGSAPKLVVKTWLPLYRQKDIAVRLGANLYGSQEWQPPEDVPEDEWKNRFVAAVKSEEQAIEGKLNKLSFHHAVRTLHELYILDSYSELFEGYYGKI